MNPHGLYIWESTWNSCLDMSLLHFPTFGKSTSLFEGDENRQIHLKGGSNNLGQFSFSLAYQNFPIVRKRKILQKLYSHVFFLRTYIHTYLSYFIEVKIFVVNQSCFTTIYWSKFLTVPLSTFFIDIESKHLSKWWFFGIAVGSLKITNEFPYPFLIISNLLKVM